MTSPQIPHRGPTLDVAPRVRNHVQRKGCPTCYSTPRGPRFLCAHLRAVAAHSRPKLRAFLTPRLHRRLPLTVVVAVSLRYGSSSLASSNVTPMALRSQW
eukprot:10569842-Heterocapsa_arctica.AAC.1